jgi:hypothetical protein
MRFDFKAYEKVYPAQAAPQTVDTAVDGFNPTAEKAAEMAKDEKPGEPDPKPDDIKKQDPDPAGQGDTPPAGSEDTPPEGE